MIQSRYHDLMWNSLLLTCTMAMQAALHPTHNKHELHCRSAQRRRWHLRCRQLICRSPVTNLIRVLCLQPVRRLSRQLCKMVAGVIRKRGPPEDQALRLAMHKVREQHARHQQHDYSHVFR